MTPPLNRRDFMKITTVAAGGLAAGLGGEVVELNIQEDHVHLLAMVPPKVSISDFLGTVKGRSAIRILNKFRHLKRRPYWGNHSPMRRSGRLEVGGGQAPPQGCGDHLRHLYRTLGIQVVKIEEERIVGPPREIALRGIDEDDPLRFGETLERIDIRRVPLVTVGGGQVLVRVFRHVEQHIRGTGVLDEVER